MIGSCAPRLTLPSVGFPQVAGAFSYHPAFCTRVAGASRSQRRPPGS